MMFFTDLRLINNFDPSSRNDRMTIRTGIPIDNPIRRLLDISVVLTIPVVDSTLWSWSCVFSVVLIECGLSVELVVFGGRIDSVSVLCAFTTSELLSESSVLYPFRIIRVDMGCGQVLVFHFNCQQLTVMLFFIGNAYK